MSMGYFQRVKTDNYPLLVLRKYFAVTNLQGISVANIC